MNLDEAFVYDSCNNRHRKPHRACPGGFGPVHYASRATQSVVHKPCHHRDGVACHGRVIPVAVLTAKFASPPQDHVRLEQLSGRQFGTLGSVADVIDDLVSRVVGNPASFQSSASSFFGEDVGLHQFTDDFVLLEELGLCPIVSAVVRSADHPGPLAASHQHECEKPVWHDAKLRSARCLFNVANSYAKDSISR